MLTDIPSKIAAVPQDAIIEASDASPEQIASEVEVPTQIA